MSNRFYYSTDIMKGELFIYNYIGIAYIMYISDVCYYCWDSCDEGIPENVYEYHFFTNLLSENLIKIGRVSNPETLNDTKIREIILKCPSYIRDKKIESILKED